MTEQYEITLPPFKRGIHLITHIIEREIKKLPATGLVNLFIMHTSAALTINENADASVRGDMERFLDRYVPENEPYYRHTIEGPDDMPAHIKTALLGYSVTIPVANGKLKLGTWQGIYLCEFRNHARGRLITATIMG